MAKNRISGSQYSVSAYRDLNKQKKKKEETGTQNRGGQSSSYQKPTKVDTRGSQYSMRQAGSQSYVNNNKPTQYKQSETSRRNTTETIDRMSHQYGTGRYSQKYLDQKRAENAQRRTSQVQNTRRNMDDRASMRNVVEDKNFLTNMQNSLVASNAVSQTARGSAKEWAGSQMVNAGYGAKDQTAYTQYKNYLDHQLQYKQISQDEYDKQLKQLQGSKAYEYYQKDQNAAHRKLGESMIKTGTSLKESGERDITEAQEGKSNAAKWALGAVSSGTGMALDRLTGPMWALSMYNRSAGSARGEAKAMGASEIQDAWNAAATGGVEAGSEYMFQGIGLPAKLIEQSGGRALLPSSGRIIDMAMRGYKGSHGNALSALMKLGFGVAEEEAEELAAWTVQPSISNLIYGNQLQQLKNDEVRGTMQQYRDNVIREFSGLDQDQANYMVSQMSSGVYAENIRQNLLENGMTEEDADVVSQMMTEYAQAVITGDQDRAQELEDDLVEALAPRVQKTHDYQELLDTVMSTAIMVGATGTPGSIKTAQYGAAFKQNEGADGVRRLVEQGVSNFEDEDSASRAQAMLDRINAGEELTNTQVADLAELTIQNYREEYKRNESKDDLVNQQLEDQKLLPAAKASPDGRTVAYGDMTAQAVQRDVKALKEITNRIASEDPSLQVEDQTNENENIARAIAAWQNGGFTVASASEIVSSDVAKAAFAEFTGTDLNQFEVRNRNGSVNLAKTNAAIKDHLFATAVDNEIRSAQIETQNWRDNTRKQVVAEAQQRVSGTGTVALNEILDEYDERDPVTYMTAVNASTMMYQMGKSMGAEWDSVKADAEAIFPGVGSAVLEKMYEAGKFDREKAEDAAADLDVIIGEKISQAAKSGRLGKGEAKDMTAGQTVKGTALRAFNEIANNLGVNIYFVDSIVDENGVEHRNFNGMYIDGDIYLNANETDERNIGYIFMHEVTHHLKKYAPKEYQALENAVREKWLKTDANGMMARIKAIQDNYRKQAGQELTDDQAMEEIICDAAHEFLMDQKFAKEISDQNPSLAKSVIDGIRRGLRMIRQIFATTRESDPMIRQALFSRLDMLDEAEHLWMEAYKAAVKHKAAVGIMEWEREASASISDEISLDQEFFDSIEDELRNYQSSSNETPQDVLNKIRQQKVSGYILDGKTARWTDDRINELMTEYSTTWNKDYAQAYAVMMNPRDFLRLTLRDELIERWESTQNDAAYGETYDLDEERLRNYRQTPYLKIYSDDGTAVEGHEGRHRMRALWRAGIGSVPVVLIDTDTKYGKKHLDSMTLSSQDFGRGPVNNGAKVKISDLVPINPVNIDEIKRKFGGEADVRFSVPDYTPAEMAEHRQSLIERQQEYYDDPFTYDYNETGYVFPDGKMLRMGDYGMRADDHAIATWSYDDVGYDNYQSPKAEAQKRFINEGNIRYLPESGSLELGAKIEPTEEQYDWIESMVDSRGIGILEITDTDNNTADYRDYEQNSEYPDGYDVVQDIKRFYRTGSLGNPVNQFRYSISATCEAVGMTFSKENGVVVLRDSAGDKIEEVTPDMVRQSPLGNLLEYSNLKNIIKDNDVTTQAKFLSDLMNMILKTQDPELIWAVSGTIGYNPSQTLDPNTPASATKEQKSKFAAITGNSDPQYQSTIDFTTICVKTQAIIDAMSESMKKMGRGLSEHEIIDIVYDEVYKAKEQVPCPVCYVFSRWVGLGNLFTKIKQFQTDYPEDMDMSEIRKEFKNIEKEVDKIVKASKVKGGKARDILYKQLIQTEDELEQIKQLGKITADQEAELSDVRSKLDILDHWAWLEKARFDPNYKAVPDDILFDINAGLTFATDYPAVWKFRTTRGPSLGKAAAPYTPERLGDVIRGISSPSSLKKIGEGTRPFLADTLSKNAKKTFDRAVANAKRQNRMNGQRLQSTSDFRFEYGLDYLLAFIEMEAIGAKAQMYTKVPEAVKFLASCGAEVNCSIMPKGDGVRWNEETQKWELEFSDVTGMAWEDALALSKAYDNVQPILVAIGRQHLISAMASDDITMIIPYHSSGASEARYVSMMQTIEEAVKDRTDFAEYENEHEIENATKEQKLCRNLRISILTGQKKNLSEKEAEALKGNEVLRQLYIRVYGKDEDGNKAKPDPKYVENFDENGNDADCYGVYLTKAQANVMMPYEYWDKHSTAKTADEQGKAYVEYCKSLGITPVFSGWDSKGNYHEDMDFSGFPGYWKTLIDRSMYNNDGTYHKQSAVNVSNVDLNMLDSKMMRKEVNNPLKVNDPAKTAGIVKNVVNRISAETGEKFSISEQLDADYLSAVESGDMETAQRMVNEAANAAGYTYRGYHGTNEAFTVFDPEKRGSKNFMASSAYKAFFASGSLETAQSYTGLNSMDLASIHFNEEARKIVQDVYEKYDVESIKKKNTENQEKFFERWKYEHGYKEEVDDRIALLLEDPVGDEIGVSAVRSVLDRYWNDKHLNDMYAAWETSDENAEFRAFAEKVNDEIIQRELERRGMTPHVKSLAIKLENPLIHDYKMEGRDLDDYTESFSRFLDVAKENGNDGAIFLNVEDGADFDTIYTVFDSEQFKSADPVTYDDDGNVIPLSERFNTSNPDIRFSVPEEGEVEDHVMQTAEKLEEIPLRDPKLDEGRVRLFRSEDNFVKRITGDWSEEYIKQGLVLNENTIEKNLIKMMRQVRKDSETGKQYKADTLNETKQSAQLMYYMMKAGNEEAFARAAWDAARRIVDDIDYNDDLYKKYRSLTEYLNKQKIAIPEGMEVDEDFAELIRDNAGRMKLLPEGAKVEDVYAHLCKAWPELFPENVDHPIDQILQIEYALDIIQPYREAYTSEEYTQLVERVAITLGDIVREGQAYQSVEEEEFSRKTAAMKARHQEALQRVRKQERAKKARETARANMWKQRYNERVQKDIEDRAARSERAMHKARFKRINKNVKWLRERLLTPTKDKNIPKQYRTDLANLLEAFDLQTVGSKALEAKRGTVAKNTLKLEALRQAYRNIAENDESKMFSYDDALYFTMGILAKRVDGKTIDALDIEELDAVDKALASICHQFRTYQKIRMANKAVEISEISGRIIQDMNAKVERDGIARTKGAIDTIVNFAELTPVYFFERLGAMNDMYKELRRAFDKYIENEAHIINRLEGILGPYYNRRKNGDKWVGSEAETWRDDRSAVTFDLTNGSVTLTAAQRMSLYCLSKRQQAWDHMTIGGISVTPIQTTAVFEKIKELGKGKNETPQTIVLTYEDVQKITAKLSKEQKEVADQLQELMVKDMAALGNEAHLAMYGYEAFNEENYFPIKVAGNEKDFDVNKMGDVVEKIKSFGPAKPITPGARNKLIIDDIFSVVADHCNGMNLYNAYLVPISDFIKVYNYRGAYGEEGQERDNVKDAIERAYTKKALKYIENLLMDLNGIKPKSRGGLEDVLNRTLGRAKKAAVFGNIRVALQQPTAIVRAWAELDLKYLTAGLKPQKGAMEEMREYAPIARWKGWGYYDTYMGRDIEDVMMGTNETVSDALLAGIYGTLDNLTWTAIWNGVKAETADKRKDLKVGSEEFLRYCGERASEIFDKTQVVDSTFHRSDAMRSRQIIVKSLTAFQSEPTLTFNVFRAGMAKAIAEFKDGDKATATRTFNRTVEVIVAQAILVSFAQALADAWRGKNPELPWDDDDDEEKDDPKFKERVWRNMVANFFDNVHIWNNIYLVKEVTPVMDYMFTKVGEHLISESGTESDWPKVLMFAMGWDKTSYYQSSNLLFQGLDTFATGFGQLMKKVEKGEDYDKTWYEIIQKEAGGIGYVTGLPLSTLMRDTKPIWDKLFASAFAAEEDEKDLLVNDVVNGTAKTGTSKSADKAGKKENKGKEAEEAEPEEEVFDYDKVTEKAKKAAESTSGATRNDKLWDTVSDGYTKYLDDGDWTHIDKIRDIYTGAGGDPRVFDQKVLNHVRSSYKKTINTEFTIGDLNKQNAMQEYMLAHGVTEAEISQMCYESYSAKDLKAALRMGNQKYIIEELLPLVAAGLTLEDFERLYQNRNRGAKSYTGKYSDPKYRASTGSYQWPASGPITSGFGYRSAPTAGASSNHLGIDIGASLGSPVQASDGGTVIYAGYNGGYGNQIVVRHDDGSETLYSHLNGYNVNVGDKVSQGQQIGQVGSTGVSTGPHLDFRVRVNGEFVNPLEYLNA